MKPLTLTLVLLAAAAAVPGRAAPGCKLGKYLEFQVLLSGERPLVTTQINGTDASFIIDSGAFYSTMSRASAAEFGLKLQPAPDWFRLRGVNGDVSAAIASTKDFRLGGVTVPRVDFLVGGTDTGSVGLLGQNFLGIGDVEYDLSHGAIRLWKATGCPIGALAYWAAAKPFVMLPLEPRRPPFDTHTVGTVTLNGVRLRAVFDTGAPSTVLTLAAAKRAGITPDSPGVAPTGFSTGLGTRAVRTWIGTFGTLDIAGEAIPRPRLSFGDFQFSDGDMLIGLDFFRTHRVYVANAAAKMLITYEGGPVFGLIPSRARTPDGAVIDLTDKTAEPKDADGYGRRGAALAANGRLDAALADLDKAVALAPKDASYLRLRAAARFANHQPELAAADIDGAIEIAPADAQTRLTRAELRLRARDLSGAREDLLAADKALPPSSEKRLPLGSMLNLVDADEAALRNFDAWLKAHPEDAARPNALNGRCWTRARLNRDLNLALDDCKAAVRLRPGNAAYLDSRALVRLRRGELAKALADYDAALQIAPQKAWSLYARSVTRGRMGDANGAATDRSAAIALEPDVIERGRKLGIEDRP